jgi:hypothetical protein
MEPSVTLGVEPGKQRLRRFSMSEALLAQIFGLSLGGLYAAMLWLNAIAY